MYRGYTLGKHDLIQDILNKSGFKRLRFVICTHYTEWSAAKQFRNKYFFEPNKIEDPYTWTFDHKDHKHFILYKGINIVGYAHVQLWQENRAALRIIVIDEKEQGKGYATQVVSFMISELAKRNIYPEWSCNIDNTASLKTGLKLGFEIADYYTLLVPNCGNVLCPNLVKWLENNTYP